MSLSELVECRAEHAYPGYPLAFHWQDQRLVVSKILAESHQPVGYSFRVQAGDQGIFILAYDPHTDLWSVQPI